MVAHASPLPSPGSPGLTRRSEYRPPGNTSRGEKARGSGGRASVAGRGARLGAKGPLRERRARGRHGADSPEVAVAPLAALLTGLSPRMLRCWFPAGFHSTQHRRGLG